MINRPFRNLLPVLLLGIWLALPTGARAALTDISNTPLSSPNGSVVKPNLMFVLDDSGSMNYEYTPDAVRTNQWCYDAGIEASNSTTNRNDQCAAGDVPDFSPDTNFQYYNPAITYKPAVCYNGVCTTYPQSDAYVAKTDPFNARNIDQLGASRTTLNLTNAYPERVWCVNSGSSVTNTSQCKRNIASAGSNAYLYPVLGFQTPKYRNSNPHYFRPIPTEYCETPALTSCIPASESTTVDTKNYIVPATLRWCQNAAQTDLLVPQTNCQARYDENHTVPRYLGSVVSSGSGGARARASFTVSNATAGLALNQLIVRDSAGNNPVNIINTLINATGNTVTTAQAICNAINAFGSNPDFRAGTGTSFDNCSTASAQVNVEATNVGTWANGYTINLGTAPGNKGETKATGAIFVHSTGSTGSPRTSQVTDIRVNGISIITGPLVFDDGTNVTAVASKIRDAINARVSSPDFTATSSGGTVSITAVTAGSGGNGVISFDWTGAEKIATCKLTYSSVPAGSSTTAISITNNVSGCPGTSTTTLGTTVNAVGGTPASLLTNMGFGVATMINTWRPTITTGSGADGDPIKTSLGSLTGYTATASGGLVTVTPNAGWRPYSSFNGRRVCVQTSGGIDWSSEACSGGRDGQNLSKADMFGGTAITGSIDISSISVFSGGANSTASRARVNTGSWERVDIVPTKTKYPKLAGTRSECAESDYCTYEEELQNFANWYSYYRTRINMMKTAVGQAFLEIDDDFRVGFVTINNAGAASKYLKLAKFDATNKAAWYTKLYSQTASGNTPLREALSLVGRYYGGKKDGINTITTDDAIEYDCQQCYTLLTTDGFWNTGGGQKLDGSAMDNQDGSAKRPYFDGAVGTTKTTTTITSTEAYEACGGGRQQIRVTTLISTQVVKSSAAGDTLSDKTTTTTSSAVKSGSCKLAPFVALQTPNPKSTVSVATTGISGGTANTLSDVAAYYFNNDLRPDLDNNVPDNRDKTKRDRPQRMVTYTLGLGVNGYMFYNSDYEESTTTSDFRYIAANTARTSANCSWQTAGDTCEWPAPVENALSTVDDLWHAAVNGRGKYFSARDPDSLSKGLTTALEEIRGTAGAASSAATSNANIKSGDNYAYSATFTTVEWTGEVVAKEIDITTGNIISGDLWSAKTQLESKLGTVTGDTRKIYTYNPAEDSKLIEFTWTKLNGAGMGGYFKDACVSSTGHSALLHCASMDVATKSLVNRGDYLVNYLRGQREYEGMLYRDRVKALGDIAHATPAYVRTPQYDFRDPVTPSYTNYRAANETRKAMLYVAANDGFLHALDAGPAGGSEEWAYTPRMLLPEMYKLADKEYADNHRNYVDATPQIMDIFDGSAWRTILVGGLGAGGRGYYALDITDPTAPKGLWERCASSTLCPDVNGVDLSDEDMGLSFGVPIITKLPSGSQYPGEWVVIYTSGYNNVSPGNGEGHLYVVRALTGELLFKISTDSGSSGSPSGLAKIAGWADNAELDNTTKYVYGGDLQGNMWKFDLTPTEPTVVKLAQALDADRVEQAITSRPELGKVDSHNGPLVIFGTGRYLGSCDVDFESGCAAPDVTLQVQTVYAIKDRIYSDTGLPTGTYFEYGLRDPSSGLVGQDMTEVEDAELGKIRIIDSPEPVNWGESSVNGWYIDLDVTPGERVDVDPQLVLGTVLVVGNIPQVGQDNACSVGGSSWQYQFSLAKGRYLEPLSGNKQVGTRISDNALTVGIVVFRLPGGALKALATDATGNMQSLGVITDNIVSAPRRATWREIMR